MAKKKTSPSLSMKTPNDPNKDNPNNPFVNQETSPISLPNSSIPMSFECRYWSMFLHHDHEGQDFPLIGQIPTTSQEIPNDWLQEIDDHSSDDLVQQGEAGSSSRTTLDRNARERIRRKKLSTSYSALQSILPDSERHYYKRWTAPYILDTALDYIPKLQAEIEKLTVEKSNLLSKIGKQQQELALQSEDKRVVNRFKQTLTVSINEVKTGELIIQICQQKGILDHKFSALIEKLEGEDIRVMGASSQCVSEHRSCFHLHAQISETRVEADEYVANLQNKLINWLS